MTPQQVFEQVEALIGKRPFQHDHVAATTHTPLVLDPGPSNTWFSVFKGSGGPFQGVELREPTAESPGKGGMVILTLGEPCISAADVGERFGQAGPPALRRPNAPANQPVDVSYPQDWGQVTLGYRDDCLVRVILNANQ